MLPEQVGVEIGELDRVADHLDLSAEATDLLVADVGDLFEDEFFDLALGDDLVDVSGAGFEEQGVAGADGESAQGFGEPYHPFLVGVAEHQGALAVLEDLLEGDDVADALVLHGLDHVECFVEHHFLAAPQLVELDARADVHPEFAAAGEDVGGAVLVGLQEDAEAGGGWASRSTSSLRATIWSRASRSVPASRSFWADTPARLVCSSTIRSSRILVCRGDSASLRRRTAISCSR